MKKFLLLSVCIIIPNLFYGQLVLTTNDALDITASSARLGGNVSSNSSVFPTSFGIVYSSTTSSPFDGNANSTTDWNASASGFGTFDEIVGGLSSNTTYYFRTVAWDNQGSRYHGPVKSFTTDTSSVPVVSTAAAFNITATSASLGGTVSLQGTSSVTERGVVYSSLDNTPLIGETDVTKDTNGAGIGSFNEVIASLSPSTTYYYRTYATNASGTGYGPIMSFTTLNALPGVATATASSITSNTATLGGDVTSEGASSVTERGVVYSTTDTNPTIGASGVIKDANGSGSGTFSETISSLSSTTTYYFRAYAINASGTSYGNTLNFTTPAALPTVTTTTPSSITTNSAVLGGNVTSDGGASVFENGVVYSTTDATPTIGEPGVTKNSNASGLGTFSETISGLSPNTTYYVSAYASNASGTSYGSVVSFTTTGFNLPTVTTTTVINTVATIAVFGGDVTDDGGVPVTQRGTVYSTTDSTPEVGEAGVMQTFDGAGTGTFSNNVVVDRNTTYYYRAYATNSEGTAYGNLLTFTTPAELPTLTTSTPTNITSSAADLGGNITDDGGDTIIERGVVYSSTDTSPAIGEAGVVTDTNGTGTGIFNETIGGLANSTTYYVRAYAINSAGTSYGNLMSFSTPSANEPTVTTYAAVDIMQTSALLGGNVSDEGLSSVTERGIVYSTTDSTPEIGEAGVIKDTNGSGAGNFWETISGLTPGTMYYVRAYAINSSGTGYGNILTFTTLDPLTVVTLNATGANTSISFSGEIASDGGLNILSRGFLYSTVDTNPIAGAPNVFSTTSSTSMSVATFAKIVFGLTGNGTTYYYRAWANSSEEGLAYGDVLSFVLVSDATVSTVSVSNITDTTAEMGGNIVDNGGGTISERGVVYSSTNTNPIIGGADVVKDINETAMNPFSEVITGLSPNTTYYFRAYVINEAGTRYGAVVSFSTNTLGVASNTIQGFEYYPNPTKHTLHIKAATVLDNITVTTTTGQVILQKEIHQLSDAIDISQWNAGMYFIKVQALDKTVVKTIIKQ
ncbi:putative secreted protein (Por secretion system target) [Kordia periserrulae]|uniref:Putative secreted protein (Por secretion system target) n=1 Tax=Kordia periserrulae TaxID=701523 RepID=A0A2T6C673_9FLAO|nr:T9SS type A sorting domain-containing protein [Kordia periserrulae]PTX63793.1 putative secreted protein (Por secretion system target) [Kordia periserrulae]